jgi:hypothetical protein
MTRFVQHDIKHTQGDHSLEFIVVTCIVFQFSSPAPVKLVQPENTAHNPLRQHHPLSAQMPRRGGRRDSRDGTMTRFVEYDIGHTQGDHSPQPISVTCVVFQFSSPAPVKLVQPKNTAHSPLRQHHPLIANPPRGGGRRDSRDGTMAHCVEYDDIINKGSTYSCTCLGNLTRPTQRDQCPSLLRHRILHTHSHKHMIMSEWQRSNEQSQQGHASRGETDVVASPPLETRPSPRSARTSAARWGSCSPPTPLGTRWLRP